MKKIIIALTVILSIFLSFGFIVMNNPGKDVKQIESVSGSHNNQYESELTAISKTNEDQW